MGLVLVVGVAGLGLSALWLRDLPRFDRLNDYEPKLATHLVTIDGREVGAFFNERRTVVPTDRIPKILRQAVVSAEDKDFYQHSGVDPMGILRSALVDLKRIGTGSTRAASPPR